MNKWMGTGRLTCDPNTTYTQGENPMCVSRFTLAVDRRGKKKEGEQSADYISCVGYYKQGEFIDKYFHKGMKADIVGHIKTGSYQHKDGYTVYTTDIVVDEIEFGESKNAQVNNGTHDAESNTNNQADDEFVNVPSDIEEQLPFN